MQQNKIILPTNYFQGISDFNSILVKNIGRSNFNSTIKTKSIAIVTLYVCSILQLSSSELIIIQLQDLTCEISETKYCI